MSQRILVVEDDETVMAFAVAVLRSEGHDVLSAASIAEARALLDSQPNPEEICFVLDVVLQHESGIAFAQELIARNPNFRVLLISGFTDDVLVLDPEKPNRIAFLGKPFTKHDLVTALNEICA